ncbi:hypothetical protein [Paraflavitalea pollutisoli]|uniref:hypothetical protein n=1 Tax=Paraflavitalea pollutisoli TaxID=3034143 RepID=UPI0023ECD88D|nr:hypothetical protein [Paraflavitalea sp. H1-2-19X]
MNTQAFQVDRAVAMQTYNEANADGKVLIKKLLGDADFGKITDRVKTFDDILAIAGKTMEQLSAGCETPDEIAYRQVKLIAEVYNEGTLLDPMDTEQVKYFPWFEITPNSGFGLSFCDDACWHSYSYVGLRLCFKSRELAIDAGKKFTEIYANLLIK